MSDKVRKTDHSEKRFGGVAVQKGFVMPDELFGALKAQVQDDLEKETHRLLINLVNQQSDIHFLNCFILFFLLDGAIILIIDRRIS